jgi:hypothetical protein
MTLEDEVARLAEEVHELHALTFGGPPLPDLHTPYTWVQPLPCKDQTQYPTVKLEVTAGGGVTVTLLDTYGAPIRRVVWGTRMLLDAS